MSPLANRLLCAAGAVLPAFRQRKIAHKPEAQGKRSRPARRALQVFLGLILVAILVIYACMEPTGKLFHYSSSPKTGMRAAGTPMNPRFGKPLPPNVFQAQAQAQLQALQAQADQAQRVFQAQKFRAAQKARFMGQPTLMQQQWANGQLEQSVFQQYGTASGGRRHLERQLAGKIVEIERTCKLTDAQKKKLQLAGRGDIKRFFDRYEEIKRQTEANEQDEQTVTDIWQEIGALNLILFQVGIFHGDSLLIKSLRNTLTDRQLAPYDAMVRERRASRRRQNIENAVSIIQRVVQTTSPQYTVLRENQRKELRNLIAEETKPSPKPSAYDVQVLLVQLSLLPDEKLRRLLDEDQWQALNNQLAGYRIHEPMLKRAGLMPAADDDGAEDSDQRAASGKK